MIRLVVRSLLVLLASAFAGSVAIFTMLRLLSGDVATVLLGRQATEESLARLRAELGLDRSLPAQYADWMLGFVRGDLGQSYAAGYDIWAEIVDRLAVTTMLTLSAMLLSSIIALAAGTYAALHNGRRRATAVDLSAQVGIAVPAFWLGLALITLFAVGLRWLPAGGFVPLQSDPLETVRSLVLPVLALTIPLAATNTRFVRSAMLEAISEDYIRTARAKGRTLRGAALTHGVRNAAIPLVTVGTLQLGSLLAGTVVIESVFVLPGIGRMLVDSVIGREVLVVQSLAFILLLIVLLLNFAMDVAYGIIDPRIRDRRA